jgi:hypothetical protein
MQQRIIRGRELSRRRTVEKRCEKHIFETSEDRCGRCGHEFCGECLVYSFGPKKPPFCIQCAVAAAGIRSNAGAPPALSRRELKLMNKERMAALKRLARIPAADEPAPADDESDESDESQTRVHSSLSFPQSY